MSAVAAMPPELPDDFGVTEVRHPRRRFWGGRGVLVGWTFWERHGSQVVLKRMDYARQDEVDQGHALARRTPANWVGDQR